MWVVFLATIVERGETVTPLISATYEHVTPRNISAAVVFFALTLKITAIPRTTFASIFLTRCVAQKLIRNIGESRRIGGVIKSSTA